MSDGLTDRARKVMQLAQREAWRFHHEHVGTEHLLLGLIKEGCGVAAVVLKNLDVDLRKVRLEVEKLVEIAPEIVTAGELPQTPQVKQVIKNAMDEAHNLGHRYVGTEHLLLGLLREREGVAAHVLMNLGLTLETVRNTVLGLLGCEPGRGDYKPWPGSSSAPQSMEMALKIGNQWPPAVVAPVGPSDAQAAAPLPVTRRLAIGTMLALHIIADLAGYDWAVIVSGLEDRETVAPILWGVTLAQGSLWGLFLALGNCKLSRRLLIVLGLSLLAGRLAGEAIGQPRAAGVFFLFAAPFFISALLGVCVLRRVVVQKDGSAPKDSRPSLQFALRQIFGITSVSAVVLAAVRLLREWLQADWLTITLFGWLPLLAALVIQPLMALWATLAPGRVAWRPAALLAVSLVCGIGPPFVGKATPATYWMVACPLLIESLVILGSLLVVRAAGYRLRPAPPRPWSPYW